MRSKLLFVTSVFVASCMVTAQMVWAKKERSHKVKRVFLAEETDSIALKTDSLLNDTTKMDSLQRAIFRYNCLRGKRLTYIRCTFKKSILIWRL